MRDKQITRSFYEGALGFTVSGDYDDYLIVKKNNIELHFFTFATLNPRINYAQIYILTDAIEQFLANLILMRGWRFIWQETCKPSAGAANFRCSTPTIY